MLVAVFFFVLIGLPAIAVAFAKINGRPLYKIFPVMINFVMAQKRANAVTRELHQDGLAPDWVMASSRGDEVPNPNPGNRTQEAADRRGDVYVDSGSRTYR